MLLALATPKLWDRFSLARASPLPLWRECRPAVGAAPQLPFPLRSRGVPSHPHIARKVAPSLCSPRKALCQYIASLTPVSRSEPCVPATQPPLMVSGRTIPPSSLQVPLGTPPSEPPSEATDADGSFLT